MFRIKVEKLLNKDINAVFELLADHENYDRFPGISNSVLLEQGKDEKNGLGALRGLTLGGMKFEEKITNFERPTKLSYQIVKSKPVPFDHDFGTIELSKEGKFTRVVWISEGHIAVPFIGKLVLDKLATKQGTAGFLKALEVIEWTSHDLVKGNPV